MLNYLIIGASSGIGQNLAVQLADAGNKVYGTYNKHEVASSNAQIEYHHLDVLNEDQALDFLPEQLDGIAYCPGSIMLRPFDRIKAQDYLNDYNLQVVGAIRIIQKILPRLKAAPGASIVLFSTVAVQSGLPFHSMVSASKGAIEGLTKALAAELAPGIRVNCIAPSLTDTPLASALLNTDQKREVNANKHPLKRIGSSTDIANMATFLLGGKSGWITGQILHVDGGMSTVRS